MKFGLRKFSFRKRIAARISWKRALQNATGFKAPRGMGWVTNPKRAAYNRVYNRTSFSADSWRGLLVFAFILLVLWNWLT